ncbi:MAG: hypothetical protein IPK22_23750 [Verrucomicrobiaceae bacterium]|nr:hypothetical protein [Verrucomicrobiaceae bacterium]
MRNSYHPSNVGSFRSYLNKSLPKHDSVPQRVGLIDNIAYSLQYLEYLDELLSNEDLHYSVRKCSLKTFIVTGASIIESVLWFIIKINDESNKTEWEQIQSFTTHTFREGDESRRMRVLMERKLITPPDADMTFDTMCKKAESKKLLGVGTEVYKALNHLRKLRNKVHLHLVENRFESDWHSFSPEKAGLMKKSLHSVLTSSQFEPSRKQVTIIDFLAAKTPS